MLHKYVLSYNIQVGYINLLSKIRKNDLTSTIKMTFTVKVIISSYILKMSMVKRLVLIKVSRLILDNAIIKTEHYFIINSC